MYRWRMSHVRKRIDILLVTAFCLFFFLYYVDLPRLMILLQCPCLLYIQEEQMSLREMLILKGLTDVAPLTEYLKQDEGLHNIKSEEEDIWKSVMVQEEIKSREPVERKNSEEKSGMKDVNANIVSQNTVSENTISNNTVPENQMDETSITIDESQKTDDVQDGVLTNEVKHTKIVCPVDVDACRDFNTLIKEFYVIDSNTYVGEEELEIGRLLGSDLSIEKKDNQDTLQQENYSQTKEPQILIYHTHSQEEYADSIWGDESTTVMGAGEELARLLEQEYGFRVLHHRGKYDVGNRDYAYSKALPEIQEIINQNPSIEVVIDLHRDGVADGTHLVTEIDGKRMAQVMLFNGLSRTKRIGEIEYLKNENRQSNLAFSFQLQKAMTEYYPGLARRIYLKGYRYNMHFKPRNLLIELGAQTNTVEEVWNALPPLAHSIAMVLEGENMKNE